MTPDNNDLRLDPDEQSFVDRLRDHYTAPPMGGAERVAFDVALSARLTRPAYRRGLVPAFATIAVALLVWVTLPWGPQGPTQVADSPGMEVIAAPDNAGEVEGLFAAYDWFVSSEANDTSDLGNGDLLPDDYQVIDQLFLDG